MLTFIQAQTQYSQERLFIKDENKFIFFSQVQKALLNSLYGANLLSFWEYEQCRRCLEEADGFGD